VAILPHRPLGASGIEVSRLSLGSWRTFERMDRHDAEVLMGHARDAGIDFLDDARYDDETGSAPLPSGWSEVLFGELLRAVGWPRGEVRIANKLWWEFWPAQTAVQELEGSLERIGIDELDLLYASTLPDDLPVAVAVDQLAAVLATGRVRAWGVVNWSARALHDAIAEAARVGLPAPCAVQLPYNLTRRDWVDDPAMTAALAAGGASLVASAALAGGALSGKYAAGATGRLSGELDDPRRRAGLDAGAALAPLAARLGTTPVALAIAFTLRHPRSASTLVGATSPAQLDEQLAALELELSDDDVGALQAIGA
jgi:L-glyceraldehyde 3-phosphate reductase